ncbi:unnamed protein product [Fusarium venenatum]|uniref:Uncharacterized protein n=1 Tax=Fusarium venenatum TaxID=56646 RepID=A0A2L2TZM6_9HYPO|nr:uncharacterized protein FVRRES_07977 [Fusarium venenatum]CEI67900.1 unnamed protein product [Fusarium venenatum]
MAGKGGNIELGMQMALFYEGTRTLQILHGFTQTTTPRKNKGQTWDTTDDFSRIHDRYVNKK